MTEEHKSEAQESHEPKSNTLKGIMSSVLEYIVTIIKLPFKVFAKFFTREIIKAVKKDIKTYVFLTMLLFCMAILASFIWLFIAVAVGIYFYELGNTMLLSIGYSLLFQLISMMVLGLILYFTSKKLRSLKLIKSILSFEK